MGLLRLAAKDNEPYRRCLYSVDFNMKNSDIATFISSAERVNHNGMKTAGFISFSRIAVCGIRLSYSIET